MTQERGLKEKILDIILKHQKIHAARIKALLGDNRSFKNELMELEAQGVICYDEKVGWSIREAE